MDSQKEQLIDKVIKPLVDRLIEMGVLPETDNGYTVTVNDGIPISIQYTQEEIV